MLIALLLPLALAVLLFGFILVRSAIQSRAVPTLEALLVGVVVNFFDALGIGSFAPTAAWLKFRRLVPDGVIPQTMLVGLTPPSIVERGAATAGALEAASGIAIAVARPRTKIPFSSRPPPKSFRITLTSSLR